MRSWACCWEESGNEIQQGRIEPDRGRAAACCNSAGVGKQGGDAEQDCQQRARAQGRQHAGADRQDPRHAARGLTNREQVMEIMKLERFSESRDLLFALLVDMYKNAQTVPRPIVGFHELTPREKNYMLITSCADMIVAGLFVQAEDRADALLGLESLVNMMVQDIKGENNGHERSH